MVHRNDLPGLPRTYLGDIMNLTDTWPGDTTPEQEATVARLRLSAFGTIDRLIVKGQRDDMVLVTFANIPMTIQPNGDIV